ncbi:hypothetical protein AVEN_86652-1 [Araneus ventricosus]|uniref:Uncharacterized protein n=1 Tax=Araneus ventricosus TaxID=182803 RepID=A0A4Y2RJW5_ARAVE|nr:hypothetical protein AVEN_260793-1 [Araneus ventricosus]GBN76097.1 hypothetical protein AVEN_86652-1 [Araneus ventricosus]
MVVFRGCEQIFPLRSSNGSHTDPTISMMEKDSGLFDQTTLFHSSNIQYRCSLTHKSIFLRFCREINGSLVDRWMLKPIPFQIHFVERARICFGMFLSCGALTFVAL